MSNGTQPGKTVRLTWMRRFQRGKGSLKNGFSSIEPTDLHVNFPQKRQIGSAVASAGRISKNNLKEAIGVMPVLNIQVVECQDPFAITASVILLLGQLLKRLPESAGFEQRERAKQNSGIHVSAFLKKRHSAVIFFGDLFIGHPQCREITGQVGP